MTIKANTPNEYRPGTTPTGTLTVTTDLAVVVESLHDLGFTVVSPDETSFDVADLIRWAEGYGHPEEWAKRAQDVHARAERLEAERDRYREALTVCADALKGDHLLAGAHCGEDACVLCWAQAAVNEALAEEPRVTTELSKEERSNERP